MSKYHQFTLPVTSEWCDVLGSYGQLLCTAISREFAERIAVALNELAAVRDKLKIAEKALEAIANDVTWSKSWNHAERLSNKARVALTAIRGEGGGE